MYLKIANRNENKYIYVFFSLILYTTCSVYASVYPITSTIAKLLVVFMGFMAPFVVKGFTFNAKSFLYTVVVAFFLLMNLIITNSSSYNVFMYILRFFSIYIFCYCCIGKNIDVKSKLYNIVIVICSLFLLMYFLFDMGLFSFPNQVLVVTGESGNVNDRFETVMKFTSYYGIYFRNQSTNFMGMLVNRLNGPFTEPGLYQIIINYGIYYYLFSKEKKSPIHFIVLLVSLLFCTSTMGYLIAIIIVSLYFIRKIDIKTIIITIPIAIICFYLVELIVLEKTNTISYLDRTTDLLNMLQLIKDNFIIGCGFNQGSYSTNGLLTIISSFGLFSLLLVIPYYKSTHFFCKRKINSIIAFVTYLTLFLMNEPIGLSNYTLLFISIGIISMFQKRGVKNDNNSYTNI